MLKDKLRPKSNLVVPQHLKLNRRLMGERFMHFYTEKYSGSPSFFLTTLWASTFFPSIVADPRRGSSRLLAEKLRKINPKTYLSINKVDDAHIPHYEVSLPLASFSKDTWGAPLAFLKDWFLGEKTHGPEANMQQVQEYKEFAELLGDESLSFVSTRSVPAATVIANLKDIKATTKQALLNCFLELKVQVRGHLYIIFADFKIAKDEAEQLTTTEWSQIRDIDIYPLILHWVGSGFGERGLPSTASFPISKIVFGLPPDHVESARTNKYNISISPVGEPEFIPLTVDRNNAIVYEDRYAQAGTHNDCFALSTLASANLELGSQTDARTQLPHNMVVALDWVNNKFSYTNTQGNLHVEDLTRHRKADISHIRELLDNRFITSEKVDWFARMGKSAGIDPNFFRSCIQDSDFEGLALEPQLQHTFDSAAGPQDWFKASVVLHQRYEDRSSIKFSEISETGFGPFRSLARYFAILETAINENLEAVYTKWSVASVTEMLPWLTLIAKYASRMEWVRTNDEANRYAAINQGVDPDWEIPAIPLLAPNIGFLPHQKKVRNLLKDSPDLAILPVQAGGGKSLLLITDILYEIKENSNDPYIVLCPGHLVSNYVKEVAYFTNGQLNVLAITNSAIRQLGFARLQTLFEQAPRNTVVFVAYDTLSYVPKGFNRIINYGTTPIQVFPVIDFLRQFDFGYSALDEAHRVKNNTARTRAAMMLITDIPKKRLASGTMVHDSPSDLALQIMALDPTLFGSRENFNNTYGLIVKSDRVVEWKPGAQVQIMLKIRSRIVEARAMRKEWAALLPSKREWIGGVTLTPNQQSVYNDLLAGALKKMQEDSIKGSRKKALALRKFFAQDVEGEAPEDFDYDNPVDEDSGELTETAIMPYLATLEQFIIAPGKIAPDQLQGEDAISPKVLAILERVRLHIFGGLITDPDTGEKVQYGPFPGKVLIFTNNIISAEEIYELAGPELKECGILYKAHRKIEDGAKYEKIKTIRWMAGVEASMNEGLNFQHSDRLIRCESPWNPGTLEQGNSRIDRPELKKEEFRKEIFFDTVVADRTIDITKSARLISKVIAAAKFENADNAEYSTIPDVPTISMTIDSIIEFNSWVALGPDNPGLLDYAKAQAVYVKVRDEDYRQYKEDYIAKYGKAPALELIPVAEAPADTKLLTSTVYTPGMNLFGAEALGLIRIDEFLNLNTNIDSDSDDDDENEFSDDSGSDQVSIERKQKAQELKHRLVHTEYGNGYISKCAPNNALITIDLLNSYSVQTHKSQVFLLAPDSVAHDTREQLLTLVGDFPVTRSINTLATSWKPSKGLAAKIKKQETKIKVREYKVRERQRKADTTIRLEFVVANGFLGIDYVMTNSSQAAIQLLTKCGLRPMSDFYYSEVKNAAALRNQFKLWRQKGLTPDPSVYKNGVRESLQAMLHLLVEEEVSDHESVVKALSKSKTVNFYQLQHKPNNDKHVYKPYPMIQNGVPYLVLPAVGQAGTKAAMRFKRPTYEWHKSESTMSFYGSVKEVRDVVRKIVALGMTITNAKSLSREFNKLRKLKFRQTENNTI